MKGNRNSAGRCPAIIPRAFRFPIRIDFGVARACMQIKPRGHESISLKDRRLATILPLASLPGNLASRRSARPHKTKARRSVLAFTSETDKSLTQVAPRRRLRDAANIAEGLASAFKETDQSHAQWFNDAAVSASDLAAALKTTSRIVRFERQARIFPSKCETALASCSSSETLAAMRSRANWSR